MKSIYSDEYQYLLQLLISARKDAGLSQQQLSDLLGRPQSFVSKYERGERRLDVVEFLTACRFINIDPHELIKALELQRK